MPDPRVELVRELERTDEDVAAELAELDELARQVDAVRLRAGELVALEAVLPEERVATDAARAKAETALVGAREAVARAEDEEAAADADDERELNRELVRARDRLHVAELKAQEAHAEGERLAARAEGLKSEREALELRTQELSAALHRRPRLADEPQPDRAAGLAGAAEWASRARATLFVARGQLAAERDGLIRQANELGAAVVGEPLTASSAAVVARRVESALGARD